MAVVFVDGFDHYATADLLRKWTSTVVTGAAITVQPTAGRNGGGCLRFVTVGNSAVGSAARTVTAGATFVIGFAFRTDSLPTGFALPIAGLFDAGTVQCDLRLNLDGTLSVTRNGTALTGGTSTATVALNAWQHIEWRVTIANSIGASTCQVRLNGTVIITVATGQDTQNTANASANAVHLGRVAAAGNAGARTLDYDDFFVDDGTAFLGDMRVCYLAPTAPGNSSQWTATGAANGWDCANDATPDDDTTYVTSGTVGHLDLYALADLPVTPSSIVAVQTVLLHRKDDAGVRTICPTVRSGGTNYDGADVNVGDSYGYALAVRATDPATGSAWTSAGVNNLEVGAKVVA